MTIWTKYSNQEIKDIVFNALNENTSFFDKVLLGIPGSHLDQNVFYHDAPWLKDAPFLSTMIHNPNHIGCHTLGKSESFFTGTQKIERELIDICAKEILKGGKEDFDGYVASGGTEANMQAIWIYRNYFMQEFGASHDEIFILCSDDSHYSMDKASNVLGISIVKVKVNENDRSIDDNDLNNTLRECKKNGKKYAIIVANMMTTMFGSVDDPDQYVNAVTTAGIDFKLHVDGAYGGFFYPFSSEMNKLDFHNPHVSSVTLDAHKMVQAPYGTGIFLTRKGNIHYANTKEASYVEGEDYTLIGSRSGANALAVWMILRTYGPYGWYEKITTLLNRTRWFADKLEKNDIKFYRQKFSNIITIRSKYVNDQIGRKYGLVPDNHESPNWYKVVVMEHVTMDNLVPLLEEISLSNGQSSN